MEIQAIQSARIVGHENASCAQLVVSDHIYGALVCHVVMSKPNKRDTLQWMLYKIQVICALQWAHR